MIGSSEPHSAASKIDAWKNDPNNFWCLQCDRGTEGCNHPFSKKDES